MASLRTRGSSTPKAVWTRGRSGNVADIDAITALLDRLEREEAQMCSIT
jgi:hypothetical protein